MEHIERVRDSRKPQPHYLPRILATVIVFLAAALWGSAALAQTPDLSGDWSLEVSAILPIAEVGTGSDTPPAAKGAADEDCSFSGTASLAQDGTDFAGTASLDLVTGVVGCPGILTGDISGTVDPGTLRYDGDGGPRKGLGAPITGQIQNPDFGVSSFSGTVVDNGDASGPFSVVQGPFQDAIGSWVAAPLVSTLGIPTATPAGLASFIVLLSAASLYLLIRR